MTPQELKNSILQLAVQGKLVEQRPEEGNAEELFKKIQEEKQRLIVEKKIKKEKPMPEITDDEKPFDIPESWKFIRIANICQLLDGEKIIGANYPYLEAKYLRSKTEPKVLSEGKFVKRGAKVILVDGENSGEVFDVLEDGYMGSTFKILYISSNVCSRYILFYLELHRNTLKNNKRGAAIPHLDKQIFFNLLLPLPPLAEQKRIVAKIEELLPFIDRYEQAWSKLEQFNKRFPEDMKKSLLQCAIQGKLVEQRPEEGTAEELCKKIQEEKQRLIAEKKIKKEKPLPKITDDEKPFDIPESWKWVRLGAASEIQSSKRVFEKDYVPDGIPFFRSKEIGDLYRGEEIQTQLFITREHYEQLKKDYGAPKMGDILLTSVGTIGNTWICDGREFYYKDGNITQICSNEFMYPRFLQFYIESPLFLEQAHTTVSGTAYNALTIIKLKRMLLPLPPLAEQKRIVEKLEQLLPLCERLK